MEQEEPTPTFICCGKTFAYKIVMEMHKDTMHRENMEREEVPAAKKRVDLKTYEALKKVPCPFPNCASVSAKPGLLKKHIRKYHKPIKISMESMCAHCGNVYATQKSMDYHVRNAHSDKILQCSKCPYETKKSATLYDHTRIKHTTKYSKKSCEFCGKVLKNMWAHLKATMCGKDVDDRKLLKCPQCKRRFIDKSSLEKHIQYIHNKVKDKDCPHCSYQTYSSFNLRLHVSKVHEKTSMFQVCPHCEMRTGNLDWHLKTYHSNPI